MSEPETRFDVQPSVANHFAWLRTQLGLQRTLLAGVRTAVSLIGFGFTVAQFFQKLQIKGPAAHLSEEAPRNLGLVLIAAGVGSLAFFTVQYHGATRYLAAPPFDAISGIKGRSIHTSSYLVAFVVMLVGLAAFGSVFMRF